MFGKLLGCLGPPMSFDGILLPQISFKAVIQDEFPYRLKIKEHELSQGRNETDFLTFPLLAGEGVAEPAAVCPSTLFPLLPFAPQCTGAGCFSVLPGYLHAPSLAVKSPFSTPV